MALEYWLTIGGVIISALVGVLVYQIREKTQAKALLALNTNKLEELDSKFQDEQAKYKKLLSQKKSSETRLGQISENLIPFLDGCPYNPKEMHFLGNPIDYLVYDLDEGKIIFLEIKSGNSRASARQKTIKNIIQAGHVYYEEMRINEKGIKSRKTINTK